ncbi:MAG: intracellular septation protein [Alphaproteobacteria bacterium]|jgi:intracellular septation protein
MNKFLKFILELGPLLVFFYLNSRAETVHIADYTLKPLMAATAGFIIATVASLSIMYIMVRKLPVMPLISGVFVVGLGGLTLYLNDETFIKIKPTLVNIVFGSILLIGLKFNKVFLKMLLEEGFNLTDKGWHGLTIRWGLFFYCLAFLNEIVWHNFTTDQWVTFKVFGIMPLTIGFVLLNIRFIMQHTQNTDETLKTPKNNPPHIES